MKDVARKYQDELPRIKKTIRNAHDYFKWNYDSYNENRKFVFESTLNNDEVTMLQSMNRPQLEFNVLEAYISRLLGEFSKQEPDIEVSAYDQMRADPTTIKFVEQHLKHAFVADADNQHLRYEIYKDLLSGGYSAAKVFTEYEHLMSTNQTIKFERCEPTLCFFDPLAKLAHKGDGRFCGQLFPKSKEDFEEENPDVPTNTISFSRGVEGFNWSYMYDKEQIVLVADYYEKKRRERSIIQLRDGRVMLMDQYKKLVDEWDEVSVPPGTIGKPVKKMFDTVVRYRVVENTVIDYEETDFTYLPVVFIDGNSALIANTNNANIHQITRPYIYNAKGAQRLKNYAGISLANEIENATQAKLMVAKEALPKENEFLEAFKNPQRANVYVFNSVHEANPDMPIQNPIREVQKVPAPPEIMQAFSGADSMIQNALGSYDASLGINNNQLSGVAIVEAASQSNATAMPYIVGCLNGFQRLAQIYVDLMPKYMTTPRTLPILDDEGKRQYVMVNQPEGLNIDFDPNVLNVSLKAGASFQVQKSRTLMMVKEMMGMSPLFAQFMAEKGLGFILDNMEGKGVEELKALTNEWLQQYQQEKQAAQQQAMQNPAAIKAQTDAAKLQAQQQNQQMDFQLDMARLQRDQQKLEVDLQLGQQSSTVSLIKALTEKFSKQADLKIKHMDVSEKHMQNRHKLAHEIGRGLRDERKGRA